MKKKKLSSFEKWMLFLIIVSLFVFIQGRVILSVINYDHLEKSFVEKAYSTCRKEGLSRAECDSESMDEYGKSVKKMVKDTLYPIYYGELDKPGIVSIIYDMTGRGSGFWLLIITGIALIALVLKLRKEIKIILKNFIKILKIESILLLIGGCLLYLLVFLSLSPFYELTPLKGVYEATHVGIEVVTSLLSPLTYQILASIVVLVLVFVIKKYKE